MSAPSGEADRAFLADEQSPQPSSPVDGEVAAPTEPLAPRLATTLVIPSENPQRANSWDSELDGFESPWADFLRALPPTVGGRENAYTYLDGGSVPIADAMLEDLYEVPRFDPVELKVITWTEDPYGEKYWQFVFYGLRPTRDLLKAWIDTGDDRYRQKLLEITSSFIDDGMDGPYSWDLHGTAWRTMVLVNNWWKLRERDALPPDIAAKMLDALVIHGEFLADEEHYEAEYNHGVNQAAALYLLAVNFPDLPGSDHWLEIASKRLSEGISSVVDQDGVLVENSPYYHFYTLRLYWDIESHISEHNLAIEGEFQTQVEKMVSYAAYILQPDGQVPTIGASQTDEVKLRGVYQEMAETDPHFLYVLTQGEAGVAPPDRNVHYPVGGQTILRSDWGVGEDFLNQTQVIFDVGQYRTNHSDLDALSFHLYSQGTAFLPDSGLYTLEPGPWRDYFHGTKGHNTVVVDGKDQEEGELLAGQTARVVTGRFYEDNNVGYQSAQHTLYQGVVHRRAIALIEENIVLVIDNLVSDGQHTYEQRFHLSPEAELVNDDLWSTAFRGQEGQGVTIRQILDDHVTLNITRGEESPIDGFCSGVYEIAVPCYALSYRQEGRDASYVTMLEFGKLNSASVVRAEITNGVVNVETDRGRYSFSSDLTADFLP